MITDRVLGLAFYLHRTNLVRFFVCPECGWIANEPVALGVHLERHREVELIFYKNRKMRACPKGCGRIFPLAPTSRNPSALPLDMKEHVTLCDGSVPLLISPLREAVPAFDPSFVLETATQAFRKVSDEAEWYQHPKGQAKYDDEAGLLVFKTPRRGRPPKVEPAKEVKLQLVPKEA